MVLNNEALYEMKGGAINATMINAAARIISTILDLGRTVGSSIRRLFSKNYC